jgi:hypothetical protein
MKTTLFVFAWLTTSIAAAQSPENSFFAGARGGISSEVLATSRYEYATTRHKGNIGPVVGYVFKNGFAAMVGMRFTPDLHSIDITQPWDQKYIERTMMDASLRWYINTGDRFSLFPELGYRNSYVRTTGVFTGEVTNRYVSSIRAGGGMNYFLTRNIAFELNASYGVLLEKSFDIEMSALYFIRVKKQ